ncbi:family 1 glycosylhydrolase [Actinomadura sp. B10D3]|uniref:family 1 glycosylhydrolase n=1 Tax=Actinomadura sp. B10D3 TaxID=3153557 RepID=UPI00325DCE2F
MLASAVLLAAAAACGGGTASGGGDGDPKTLTYWASNQGTDIAADQKVLNPELAKFEKRTGIEVKLEVVPWTDLLNRILAATTSGQGPDVLNIGNTWSASLQATGGLLPFDSATMAEVGGAQRFVPAALASAGAKGKNPAAGLAFYDRLVDALLEAGIEPHPTLYHWDLPQALQDRGGWPSRDTAERFAEYASVVAAALGDRVASWTTLNEPVCAAWLGHLRAVMAPGVADVRAAVPASYHLLLAHGLGAQAVRAAAPGARVGIVNLLTDCEPGSDRDEDVAAARREDGHHNRWWLDPLHGRGLPADMIGEYGVEPPVRPGDLEAIAAPLDWLGVNYYRRSVNVADPAGPPPRARQITPAGTPRTGMDWEIHPDRLERILLRVTAEYAPRSIMVTENGSAYRDTVTPGGAVHDAERTAYLEAHLSACAAAIRGGVPLDGYFAWSLLDNFEWAYGYAQRFGLVHVDFATQKRVIKDSGHRYAEIIRAHRDLVAGAVAP